MPVLDGMDEGGIDEVGPVDVAEGTHLHSKEHDTTKPPESSTMLESREMVVLGEGDYPESSFNVFADFLEDKNVNRSGSTSEPSEQPCASPRYMDDAGIMVEELMVRDYDSSNVAIVGTSNNRERIQTRQNQWQNLYQLKGVSGSGSSHSKNLYSDNVKKLPSVWDDMRHTSFPDVLEQKTLSDDRNEVVEQLTNAEHKQGSNYMSSHGGIRTKIFSKSGFSEFFIKSTLKGKGIVFRGPPLDAIRLEPRDMNNGKGAAVNITGSSPSQSLSADTAMPSSFGLAKPRPGGSVHEGVSLREWLKTGRHKMNKVKCLHIFKQIVDAVDYSHSQGTPLRDLLPSSFKLSQMNQVKYLGTAVQRDMRKHTELHDVPFPGDHVKRRQPVEQGRFPYSVTYPKKQKFGNNTSYARRWPQFTPNYVFESQTGNYGDNNVIDTQEFRINQHNPNVESGTWRNLSSHQLANAAQHQTSIGDQLEENWYMSPEEQNEGICTVSSNIYSLGVLLFELLGRFDSERAHATAMLELRHRILPPHFLSENPKEAGFCLWLLHPEPSSRPRTREILQSEIFNGLHEMSAEEQSLSIDQDDAESELLLHFLVSSKEHKQKDAAKLMEEIRWLDADIGEVERRNLSKMHLHRAITDLDAGEFPVQHKVSSSSDLLSHFSFSSDVNKMRFLSNISQLESAYLSMRSTIHLPGTDATKRQDKDVLRNRENWNLTPEAEEEEKPTDCVGTFFDGLCKYARYSKFEVRGLLRTGDFNNSANVICSLSFDRDAEYFAAAGVSKKIKIFEYQALFNDSVDIHYPVIEMSNKSKLSCVCWNNYVKNYLASTGYDGVVKLWDVSTGQGVFQYGEHEKRAWTVDFSQVCPTKLASGSDDCSVKLWSINEKNSLGTIWSIANVCSVQFSSHSTHLLAFGSADYRTYCYDLRNVRTPWCVLAGHEKAVSYVKFVDHETLVTASTDNSLKIWNLNKTSSSGLSAAACSLTLGGHTNEKNFVGLSVADGYIACGSETNEVYAYHKSLPMPITSHKFGSIDPISGKDTDDDNGQFVSSVCWRGNSDMIIAANSSGCIKVLQMT